jgi:uncharacterized protein YbjT (DUF2867 family)
MAEMTAAGEQAADRILLTGATGYVGGRMLRKLEDLGRPVRCIVRRPEVLSGRKAAQTEIVRGDVLEPESLRDAFSGITVAYYLVHSMAASGPFAGADRRGAENFARAARESGVRRIVYLGGLGADDDVSAHLGSRHEVGRILRESGVPTVEFRASVIIGSGSISFEIVRALVDRMPVLLLPRWVVSRTQPIAIEDVLAYLLAALDLDLDESTVFEIGGPDRVAYAGLMREYARQAGLRRAVIRVPLATRRVSGFWLTVVTPVYASIGRELIESLRNDTVVRDRSAREVFPIRPRGFREAIEATGWYYGNGFWRLRGLLDKLVGGVGLRRGRRDPMRLVVGDTLDFWRVEAFEPDRLLRLSSEMKTPGRIWLQLEVDGDEGGSTVRQTAIFDPHGLAGLAYWYALYPVHHFIFEGMLRRIERAAIASGGQSPARRRGPTPRPGFERSRATEPSTRIRPGR